MVFKLVTIHLCDCEEVSAMFLSRLPLKVGFSLTISILLKEIKWMLEDMKVD